MRYRIDDVDRSFYRILDVDQRASLDQIRVAHRRRARILHPDMQAGNSERERQLAERRMREVNEAWTVLSDPVSRREYDEALDHARLLADADRVAGQGEGTSSGRPGGLGGSLPDNFDHADPAYARAFNFDLNNDGHAEAVDPDGTSTGDPAQDAAANKRRNFRSAIAAVAVLLVAGAFLVITAYAGNTADDRPGGGPANDPITTVLGKVVSSTIESGD